ncbi:hypothetical protein [Thalassotalea eurytherma]|uniref:Uncharacterized protein n=1 Tax=Thalassotalea eurytherma TaxID=1144278 RepID=A0ABQ6GZS3_9GAMM|nr:hypothetical protein [Thalassotalea eurytherma]GLX81357.1 hypothetical protein theurythT_08090 [Thalassotalea eurytherma]
MATSEANQTQFNESNNEQNTSLEQQLADANKQIEELRLQISWLERSYE